ncbi:MAG TPA: PH domain-containing protein [Acidimicrobiales bacterium]|nr:PH domain-containing protein [Acidimicrobiales bacterium]
MSPLRRRRGDDDFYGGGELSPVYPEPAPLDAEGWQRAEDAVRPGRPRAEPAPPPPVEMERPPGLFRRAGAVLDGWRKKVLPLPDEVIEQYLGHGERMIHSDHPSLQAFIIQNTILFAILFVAASVFLGITFNGSLVTAGFTLLLLSVVLLILVLRRLRERYTSYVVTNVRIMRISGVIARRAHSIPWVRVTDLTYEQSLSGRLFGYATLHIESANEDSGLRDLEGVNDPVKFNQYVVDMVVAKQGPTAPGWEEQGEPPPIIGAPQIGIIDRMLAARRRRRAERAERKRPDTPSPHRSRPARPPAAAVRSDPVFDSDDVTAPAPRVDPSAPYDIDREEPRDVVTVRDPTMSGDYDDYDDLGFGGPDSGLPWRR